MAERRPPGFNVDLKFYDSDEVMSIPRRIRAAAIGVWTLAGAYSANKLSDGYVTAEKLKQFGCTPAIRAALMATTPEPLWSSAAPAGAVQFTRWSKWQRTCDEVRAYRDSEATRKRNERKAKRDAATSTNAETSARTTPGPTQKSRDPSTKTENREKEVVTYVANSPAADDDQPPPRVCVKHPDGTDTPCGACANARRKSEEWQNAQTIDAVTERQSRLAAIANCPDCDEAGWLLDTDDAAVRCEHLGLGDV